MASAVTQFIRRLASPRADPSVGDAELLRRFAAHRDEAAFEGLLRRHAPMVWGVCRRLLRDAADAEDAFQATFVVLVRKAGSIRRPALLGNWLYGVAYRTALKARGEAGKRRKQGNEVDEVLAREATPGAGWAELRAVLDEEVRRLPAKYLAPFVLCYLEGKTNEEAACLLGCPKGTVASRLARARERLRGRLTRRGVALSAAALALLLTEVRAPAAVPARLSSGITSAGGGSQRVTPLAEGVLRAMFLTRSMHLAALLFVAGVLAGAGALLAYRCWPPGQDGTVRLPELQTGRAEEGQNQAEPKAPNVELPARRWGDLKGRFVYDGTPPAPKTVDLKGQRDAAYFEKADIQDESLLVAKDGGLASVFVYVLSADVAVHPDYEKTANAEVTCTLKDGRFEPHVLPVRVGQRVVFVNAQVVADNAQVAPLPSGEIFNVLLSPEKKEVWQPRQPMRLPAHARSAIHPWMGGWLLARSDPYTAVSAADGTFTLRNLPAGRLEFRAWHERSGYVRTPAWSGKQFAVTIREGENDLGTIKLAPRLFEQ